jgi:hypothetical protein
VAQSTCFSTTQELTGQGAKHKVFVDTDNLTDLTRLFTVVSNEVDAKLLVLSSCFCCFSHGKSAIQYHLRESIGHIHITIYIFIDLVLFGSDIFSSKSKDMLVIVGTSSVLTRKWCLGEITTARVNNVPTVILGLADFELPKHCCLDTHLGLVNTSDLANY